MDYIVKSSSALDELVRKIIKTFAAQGKPQQSKKSLRKLIGYLGLVILAVGE